MKNIYTYYYLLLLRFRYLILISAKVIGQNIINSLYRIIYDQIKIFCWESITVESYRGVAFSQIDGTVVDKKEYYDKEYNIC